MAQLSALVKSSIFVLAMSNFGIVHFKRYILQLCKNKFGFMCTLRKHNIIRVSTACDIQTRFLPWRTCDPELKSNFRHFNLFVLSEIDARDQQIKCSRVSHLCIGRYPVYYKILLNLGTKLNWPSSPFHVETVLFYSQEYIPQHVKMTFTTSRTR